MRTWTELAQDRSGAVAIVFAATMPVALLLVMGGIDYSRTAGVRVGLQNATDSAALALARNATPSTTSDTIASQAPNVLAAATGSRAASIVSATLSNSNTQVCLTSRQTVPSVAAKIIGIPIFNVEVKSCAATNTGGGGGNFGTGAAYEIALALDNTGSMANSAGGQSKLESAKKAAIALIDQVTASGTSAVFSVVPFSTSVNVGASHLGASWLDTGGRSSAHWQTLQRPASASWLPTSRFDLLNEMKATWAGCIEERPDPFLTTDRPASPAEPDSLFVPYFWPDEGDVTGSGSAFLPGMNIVGNGKGAKLYSSSNWDLSGALNNYLYDFGGVCAASATDPYEAADVADPVSRGGGATKVCKYKGATGVSSSVSSDGPNKGCIANPLMTLTSNTAALTSKINSMQANGTTNLLPGFMWGWRTISPNGPFTSTPAPQAYGTPGVTKILVFMTDGFNNWRANSGYAYKSEYNALGYFANNRLAAYGGVAHPPPTGSPNYDGPTNSNNWRMQMDSALLAACTNAKAAGVVVYTIGFSTPNDPIDNEGLQLLSKCASGANRFYVAKDSSSLSNAFADIGTSLSRLRLVR